MAEGKVLVQVMEQADYWWNTMFRPRMAGLSDHEFLWEPAPGCWSVRTDATGRAVPDGEFPEPYPPPLTTIAWRMCHMSVGVLATRVSRLFENGSGSVAMADFPLNASEAIAFLERWWNGWRQGVERLGDDGLWKKVGPTEGVYQDHPFVSLVLHINRELIHHGAELAVMRDLYWATHRNDPIVDALLRGDRATVDSLQATEPDIVGRTIERHPDLIVAAAQTGDLETVRLLADLGFDVNAMGRRSPLHQAVQSDNLDMVRFLVERGADTRRIDPIYQATPLGWAQFFSRPAIAAYLDGAS